jgi:hypothetical protein
MYGRAATMRTSDAERQRAAEFLRDACGEGRLTPEELEDRLDRLFAGTTVEHIAALVRDLPGGSSVIPRYGRAGTRPAARPLAVQRRRRSPSPAVPVGVLLLIAGIGGLVFAALPPLAAVLVGAIALSVAIGVGVIAVALAPVALLLFLAAWLAHRVLRGPGGPPGGWPGARARHRRRF